MAVRNEERIMSLMSHSGGTAGPGMLKSSTFKHLSYNNRLRVHCALPRRDGSNDFDGIDILQFCQVRNESAENDNHQLNREGNRHLFGESLIDVDLDHSQNGHANDGDDHGWHVDLWDFLAEELDVGLFVKSVLI